MATKGQRGDGSAYASGMRGDEKPPEHGPLRCVRIERADNGYTVTREFDPKPRKGNKGDSYPYQPPRRPSVFESLQEACDFARAEFEAAGGDKRK